MAGFVVIGNLYLLRSFVISFVDQLTMPLWSNEEWRARIGSSWCAIGRPVKGNLSIRCQGKKWGLLPLSSETMLWCRFLMTVTAVVIGFNFFLSLVTRYRKVIRGKMWNTGP